MFFVNLSSFTARARGPCSVAREIYSNVPILLELARKALENTPDPRYLYKSTEILETYSRLLYAVRSNLGAVNLTGDSGCGKTLLSRALIQELDPEKTDVALLANPCRNPEELLREILFQIGEEDQEGEQRSQILHRLNALLYEKFVGRQGNGRRRR